MRKITAFVAGLVVALTMPIWALIALLYDIFIGIIDTGKAVIKEVQK